jgi:hypothetical protein
MPSTFSVALRLPADRTRVEQVTGWVYNGLGLSLNSSTRARYRRKDGTRKLYESWSATHLNTGHLVRGFRDLTPHALLAAATALAELTDWDFIGLDGWKNRAPDLMDRLQDWHQQFSLAAHGSGSVRDEAIARNIGVARAA